MEVTQGEIKVGARELAEKTGVELTKKNKNPYQNLFYETKHLPLFEEFDKLIGLDGKQYLCLKKARYYQLLGGILQKKIKLGGVKTDTRLQVVYPLPTEAGKNALIYSIKYLVKEGIFREENKLYTMSEPISYSAESLVGKYVEKIEREYNEKTGKYKNNKKRIENRGHFDNDFLELDECSHLILGNDEQTKQAREYFSKSENPIGLNEVEKRLVDDLPTEKVSYFPKNTNSFYFQPSEKLPEHVLTQGFLRRKLIPVGDISKFLIEANEETFTKKTENSYINKEEIAIKIIKFLTAMKDNIVPLRYTQDFGFTDEAVTQLNRYALTILRQGKIHSEKIANYCKFNKYTTHEYLIKMSCILASSYGTTKVDEKFVSLAFMDLTEFMQHTYDFVKDYVNGSFDYGVTWKGAKYYDASCLKYLYENECLSFDSSKISIDNFLKKIMEVYPNDIKEPTARKHYLRMKEEGWIEGKQKGQYESRVWIKFNPKITKQIDEGIKGDKGYTLYKSVFEGTNDILSTLSPLLPREP